MARVVPRLIQLFLATSTVDRSDEVSKFKIASAKADVDFLTFLASRQGGPRDYRANFTIAQDHASATLWTTAFTGAGTLVTGKYAPYGNAVASVAQPHYTFTAIVAEPDGDLMGADADLSPSQVATVDLSWLLTGKPVAVTS